MSKRILIVEDDYSILCLLTDLLNEEGYEVAGMTFTPSIVESIMTHKPDLVMLDFLIPGVNGGELCQDIKGNELTASVPVILLSAHPRFLQTFGDYGSDGFVPKPFNIDEVIHTIERCLINRMQLG
jgi:DNA-binding response OmpR family regulator